MPCIHQDSGPVLKINPGFVTGQTTGEGILGVLVEHTEEILWNDVIF